MWKECREVNNPAGLVRVSELKKKKITDGFNKTDDWISKEAFVVL